MAEKLVRDYIPYIMMENGDPTPKMRVATDPTEQFDLFVAKLVEEVGELRSALSDARWWFISNPERLNSLENASRHDAIVSCAAEAADVMEVLDTIFGLANLEKLRLARREERGGFINSVVVDFPETTP